jgi:hypothetical protein
MWTRCGWMSGRYFMARGEPLLPHCVFIAEADGKIVGMLELSLDPMRMLRLFAGAVYRGVVRRRGCAARRYWRRTGTCGGGVGAGQRLQ